MWELKLSTYRVANWPIGDLKEFVEKDSLGTMLNEMFAVGGQSKTTPEWDQFAILSKGQQEGYRLQLREYISNPWGEPKEGSAFVFPPEVSRKLQELKVRMEDITKNRKWKNMPSWIKEFVQVRAGHLRLAHEILSHFFVATSNEAHVESTIRLISLNMTPGGCRDRAWTGGPWTGGPWRA